MLPCNCTRLTVACGSGCPLVRLSTLPAIFWPALAAWAAANALAASRINSRDRRERVIALLPVAPAAVPLPADAVAILPPAARRPPLRPRFRAWYGCAQNRHR